MVTPIAPDWLRKDTRPGGGAVGANVAFIEISAAVFSTPMQLGPTIRMP